MMVVMMVVMVVMIVMMPDGDDDDVDDGADQDGEGNEYCDGKGYCGCGNSDATNDEMIRFLYSLCIYY